MNTKTSELTGAALDWAVAKCEGRRIESPNGGVYCPELCSFSPRQNWAQAGEIIERERIQVFPHNGATEWCGVAHVQRDGYIAILTQDGSTPLIAAMRCYVASKMGDEVDVPEELL